MFILESTLPNFDIILEETLELSDNELDKLFNTSNVDEALDIKLATSVFTKAVVAICVLFVPLAGVGAIGNPVNSGDSNVAYVFSICVLL